MKPIEMSTEFTFVWYRIDKVPPPVGEKVFMIRSDRPNELLMWKRELSDQLDHPYFAPFLWAAIPPHLLYPTSIMNQFMELERKYETR